MERELILDGNAVCEFEKSLIVHFSLKPVGLNDGFVER